MSIYLVRHGQTNSNRDRIVQTPQTPLSKLGEIQAQQLAQHYSQYPVSVIICSDYLRTQQTAAPLHKRLGCDLVLSELLRERNFGDLRGKNYADIDQQFMHPDYQPDNGENYQQFQGRVEQAWKSILNLADDLAQHKSILIMTHGLVLQEIFTSHLMIDSAQLESAKVVNTCVTEVQLADKKTLIKFCDSSHLQQKAIVEGRV